MWGGLWYWLTIRFSTHRVIAKGDQGADHLCQGIRPDSFENKMWKLICVKLASWHFIKTPSKTNIPQCHFWKMPLNQWHDLERYPAAKTILKTLLPQDHKLPWSLWQLPSSMPWKTPLYLFSSMSFLPPTSPINNLLSTWAKLKNSKYLAYLA